MTADAMLRLAWCAMSPKRIDTLLERFHTPTAIVDAIVSRRVEVSDHVVEAASVGAGTRRRILDALGVRFVTADEPDFPTRLSRYPSSPRWLFAKGPLPRGPAVAVVGTRTCTTYGSDLARDYGAVAAESGWIVVSGLARGIDHAAHAGAVRGLGTCVAVLGSGIDVVYPRRHAPLLAQILDGGGCVVSEYPPGTRPDGWRFPTRNRVIAAMSDLVIVVEAGVTGGALITARIAIDYGIPVMAPPGDIDRTASIGTNHLIRDGAFPIFDADDLRTTLSLITPFDHGTHDGGREVDVERLR